MLRKILPFLFLVLIVVGFIWIKRHQRGTSSRDTIHGHLAPAFNRELPVLIYSRHAQCRMDCRQIDSSEVLEVLRNGTLKYDRIEKNEKGYTYPLEGFTHDQQHVRAVFAPHNDTLVVVTVIDLEKEWACDCK